MRARVGRRSVSSARYPNLAEAFRGARAATERSARRQRAIEEAPAMGLPTHRDSDARRRRKGASASLFYGSTSIATVFLNKSIFATWKFKFPATLVTAQTIFTVFAIVALEHLGAISPRGGKGFRGNFNAKAFKRVGVVSAVFQMKLVLDMKALSMINIPMYGVLKSATTPFVMAIDWVMMGKVAPARVQAAVWLTTLGGVCAGTGDLEFNFLGYLVALCSALCTAMYVVLVGKIGDELQLDSFTLLLYNSLWSAPLSLAICFVFGEHRGLLDYPYLGHFGFLIAFLCSCSSAFILNYATYLCTQLNEALTTSVVGRTKGIVQGVFGLFAFHVRASATNVAGIILNSAGVAWYAYEKYTGAKRSSPRAIAPATLNACVIHREDSQLTLESSARSEGAVANERPVVPTNGRMALKNSHQHAH